MTNVYAFTVQDIDGKSVPLSAFKGKVLLIVNVASKCGFTGQYDGLQKLYTTHTNRALSCWASRRTTSCGRSREPRPRSRASAR